MELMVQCRWHASEVLKARFTVDGKLMVIQVEGCNICHKNSRNQGISFLSENVRQLTMVAMDKEG